MTHDLIDILAFIAAVLGLVSLWLEPAGKTKRQLFLVIALTCSLFTAFLYLSASFIRSQMAEQRAYSKVVKLLCANDLTGDELTRSLEVRPNDQLVQKVISGLLDNGQLEAQWKIAHIDEQGSSRGIPVRLLHLKSGIEGPCPFIGVSP
jgi:hypothetical protein